MHQRDAARRRRVDTVATVARTVSFIVLHEKIHTTMSLTIQELETPIPLVDMDRLARNLDRAAAYATEHGLALRPHIKTHKSPRIAGEQLRRGAVGLTCATPFEAEVMSQVCDDILIAYPTVSEARADSVA